MYRLKKSLGQHFLKDDSISARIAKALDVFTFDQLLEVGPGGGALTKHLLQLKGIDLKAVELDEEMISYLLRTYPALEGRIIHKSFLEMKKPFEGEFIVIGNFPYNISSQILFRVLEWKDSVPGLVGMFQKEVAQRVVSRAGSKVYGVISVLVQAFYEVEYLFDVDENSFNPPPKVKSGVLRMSRRKKTSQMRTEADLFLLVKTAFNQRRKTLRNAVKGLFGNEELESKIFDKRAEQLTVDQFCELTFKMK